MSVSNTGIDSRIPTTRNSTIDETFSVKTQHCATGTIFNRWLLPIEYAQSTYTRYNNHLVPDCGWLEF